MSDVISDLSERDIADLCALADGTLPAARRTEVEARVAASAEMQALLERQRASLAATRALAAEPTPASLTTAIEAGRRRPSRARPSRRRLGLALSAAGALAAVVAVVLVLSLAGGPTGPSVADAAQLALQPASGPAPATNAGGGTLAVAVQGLVFPDLAQSFGWKATGVRHGSVGGRDATAVYYEKDGRQMAYAIIAGEALPRPPDGQSTTVDGVQFQTLSLNGRPVVTWERFGHTCVMIGATSPSELLTLASWRGGGAEGY